MMTNIVKPPIPEIAHRLYARGVDWCTERGAPVSCIRVQALVAAWSVETGRAQIWAIEFDGKGWAWSVWAGDLICIVRARVHIAKSCVWYQFGSRDEAREYRAKTKHILHSEDVEFIFYKERT